MTQSWPSGRVPKASWYEAVSPSAELVLIHRPAFSGVVCVLGGWVLTCGIVKTGGQPGGGFATVTRSGLASEYAKGVRSPPAPHHLRAR